MKRTLTVLFVAWLGLVATGAWWVGCAYADDCNDAEKLFKRSLRIRDRAKQKQMLLQSVKMCPTLHGALNNLGDIFEKEGDLDQAESYYKNAIDISPRFPHPYVGLAEVYQKRGDLKQAVEMYQEFLRLAEKGSIRRHYPELTPAVIASIEERMAKCEASIPKSPQDVKQQPEEDSSKPPEMVSAETILAKLTEKPERAKGISTSTTERASTGKIAIRILFASGSAEISPQSLPQMMEIGRALSSERLGVDRVSIEGHTDSVGDDYFNQRLSEQRAESVRRYLISHFGISAGRLLAVGYGESQPIASNDTSWGRAQNRRVEFINLGGGGTTTATAEEGFRPAQSVGGQKWDSGSVSLPDPGTDAGQPVSMPNISLKIAILELDYLSETGRRDPIGRMVTEYLTTAAVNTGVFNIVERQMLHKVLKELELDQSGIVDTEQAREIGQMLGADAVFTGSVSKLGNSIRLDVRLINVQTGRIMVAGEQITNRADLQGISTATKLLMRDLVTRLPQAMKAASNAEAPKEPQQEVQPEPEPVQQLEPPPEPQPEQQPE